MGELQGVRSGKADKGAAGRDLPAVPDAGDDVAGQSDLHNAAGVRSRVRQVWGAYAPDGTDLVLFGRELEGLRYAAANGMRCKALDFGRSVMEQIRGGLE
jgi:hypothetical protein